jgi:hypothetical protein
MSDHLGNYHGALFGREQIEEQLTYEPDVETRNRKPPQPPGRWNCGYHLVGDCP